MAKEEPELLATTVLVSSSIDKWVCNELHWIAMNPPKQPAGWPW